MTNTNKQTVNPDIDPCTDEIEKCISILLDGFDTVGLIRVEIRELYGMVSNSIARMPLEDKKAPRVLKLMFMLATLMHEANDFVTFLENRVGQLSELQNARIEKFVNELYE